MQQGHAATDSQGTGHSELASDSATGERRCDQINRKIDFLLERKQDDMSELV
jgi:hypothetical protein